VFSAPFAPSRAFLEAMPWGRPNAVYHGPTSFIPLSYDPYKAPKAMGIFREIRGHAFQNVNAGEIVQRIFKSRDAYEERQRAKLKKSLVEADALQKEAADRNGGPGGPAA
jgi:ethanolamine-phosphate cytidylyltransferase